MASQVKKVSWNASQGIIMEYHFKIIIEECEEGGYYAECPAFQGCHVEGDTYEETIR